MSDAVIRICVLGMRRTGSNHLFGVLRNFDDLVSCGELFSDRRVTGARWLLPEIRQITGLTSDSEEDPFLRAYARGNPRAFMKIVAEAALRQGKRAVAFKIFEDQLTRPTIEADILDAPGTHLALLVRHSLPAYISLLTAEKTGMWMSFDTNDVMVRLDAEAFAEWLEQQRRWYGHWLQWFKHRGRPATILTYERDVHRPLRVVLWRFARVAARFDLRLRHPLVIRTRGLRRQDHRAPGPRISNWAEFRADLAKLGLENEAYSYPIQL